MIRLAVVGLGSIFSSQFKALTKLGGEYKLTHVFDIDSAKLDAFFAESAALLPSAPRRCKSADELFGSENIDAVLIATPPDTHFALALNALERGLNVLLEKPAVADLSLLDRLYGAARSGGGMLHTAFHAAFARDVEQFLSMRSGLGLGALRQLDCGFYDPYMENGRIAERKRALGGSFLDSGVNALSVCARFLCLDRFEPIDGRMQSEGGTVFHGERTYSDGERKITIRTGWDLGKNEKTTLLRFENADVLLDHSRQCVTLIPPDGETRTLFHDESVARLTAHYLGVFRDFSRAMSLGQSNEAAARTIHRLLLQ